MKKIFSKVIKTLFSFTLFAAMLSCQIGLGPAVDLQAPELEVISPASTDSVPQTMTLKGKVSDNIAVTQVLVTISETNQQYKWAAGKGWQYYEDSKWQNYARGTSSGDEKNINWTLTMHIDGAVSGEDYTIVTLATDANGNEGKNSKDERTVTVDTLTPTVSIIEPIVTNNYSTISTNSGTYKLKDNNVIQYLLNDKITISGSQVEDCKLSYLYVMLDDKTDDSMPEIDEVPDFSSIPNVILKKLNDSNLRNFTTVIDKKELPEAYHTGRHLLRLSTESHDLAGNIERKVHGWFIYDNDADIPWVVAKFGDDELIIHEKDGDPFQKRVYPSCTLQGQAYDDDGIKSVTVKVSIYDSTNKTWTEHSSNTYNLADQNYPTYYAWSVNAISDNKNFKIEANCIDVNGNESETVTQYLGISDVNPPSLTIESPANGATVIGDASGNFTITGKAVDDGKIASLKMVRIANANKNDMLLYFSSEYEGWTSTVNNNKLFNIAMTGGETPVGGYYTKTFNRQFNIFTDFGINATEVINTLNFVFMVTDESGSSTIESFTLQGDTEAPQLSIDSLTVYNSAGTKIKDYYFYDTVGRAKTSVIPTLETFNRSSQKISDKISLSGTWSDNTTDVWGNSKISDITLTWAGEKFTVTKTGNTWTTNKVTPPDATTASITAQITDWGGNTTKVSESYYVNGSKPELVRFGSTNSDGAYKVGDEITITMEYNKRVTFSGGTGATLTLNNGGKATYDSESKTNGSAKHYYKYVVAPTDSEVAALDVTKIEVNTGTVWKDADNSVIVSPTVLPGSEFLLKKVRSITVDKTLPTLKTISAITSGGYYNEGKEIFIQATFSEDVNFSDVSKIKLNFSFGKSTSTVTKTSSKTLLFKYTIGSTDTASPLSLTGDLVHTGCEITDKAGNKMVSFALPSNLSTAGIYIDTTVPDKPVITGLVNNSLVYSEDGVEFEVTGFERTSSSKKYSIDGGSTWQDYTGKVKLQRNGTYTVTAKQDDAAGNVSENAEFVTVSLDMGEILNTVSTTVPDGTYSTGKVIPIILKFRKPVTATGSKIVVNVANDGVTEKEIPLTSGNGTNQFVYEYTVADKDSCTMLNIKRLEGTFKDSKGNDIDDYIHLPEINSGNSLVDSRTINVSTTSPEVKTVVLDQSGTVPLLKITYNVNVNKGTGKFTITQSDSGYKAPVILSVAAYQELPAAIKAYYELGTNGASSAGVSDLAEKYILKYEYDSDDETLCGLFIDNGVLVKEAEITSNAVTIAGKVVTITLSNALALPVKGTTYAVDIPAGIVIDDLNHTSLVKAATVTYSGVEAPVIRINKASEILAPNTMPVQPLTAEVKMDCQTPDAEIYYVDGSKTVNTRAITSTNFPWGYTPERAVTVYANNGMPTITKDPKDAGSEKYEAPFTVGDATAANYSKGIKVFLRTKAKKTADGATTWSADSYETAFRSVVILDNAAKDAEYNYMWIRGGDQVSGGVSTPNFPFSWTNTEFDKIRGMTNYSDNIWYWITWNINTTAYVGFLAGDMPEDCATKGPSKWNWGSNSWVGSKEYYPLYPGESISLRTIDYHENFAFQGKHMEYRSGDSVKYGVAKNSDGYISVSNAGITAGEVLRIHYKEIDEPEYNLNKIVVAGDVTYESATLGTFNPSADNYIDIRITSNVNNFTITSYTVDVRYYEVLPPAGATEVLTATVNVPGNWSINRINVSTAFAYKVGTVLYFTIDANSMNANYWAGEWGTNIFNGVRYGPGFKIVITDNNMLNAFKNNNFYVQSGDAGKITSIKAYNP